MCFCLQSIQDVLSSLSAEELLKFKMCFSFRESEMNRRQVMDGDLLDFVDKMLEVLGMKTCCSTADASLNVKRVMTSCAPQVRVVP